MQIIVPIAEIKQLGDDEYNWNLILTGVYAKDRIAKLVSKGEVGNDFWYTYEVVKMKRLPPAIKEMRKMTPNMITTMCK